MKLPVDMLAEELRSVLPYPVLTAWPDVPMKENAGPVVCAGLSKIVLRPVGLGEADARLGEAIFSLDVFAPAADMARQAAESLLRALPGLAMAGEDVAYRAELRQFSVRLSLTRRTLLSAEEAEDEPILSFDWKGIVEHEGAAFPP